jgi:hypothetical protein
MLFSSEHESFRHFKWPKGGLPLPWLNFEPETSCKYET